MSSRARSGIGAWLCLSAALFLAVTVSSWTDPSQLGVPVYWTWALTGVQVLALWVAGRGHACGWIVGSVVQPGWIAYALLTDQLGFVIGCVISTGVQLSAYLRANGSAGRAGTIPIDVSEVLDTNFSRSGRPTSLTPINNREPGDLVCLPGAPRYQQGGDLISALRPPPWAESGMRSIGVMCSWPNCH